MSAPIDTDLCTYETCSILIDGFLSYRPTLAGNAVLLAIFSAFLIAQIALGIRYKTWTFLVGMIGGTALEIVGYIGRVMLYQNVFSKDNFVIYLVGLTIGPAFYSAAIYVCLARIIRIYGASLSFFKPKIITAVFICCDVVSLILQAAGGAIVSVTDDKHTSDIGLDIMIAGLAFQVVTTTIFIIICLQIVYSVRKYPERINVESESLRLSRKFKLFSCGKFWSPAPRITPSNQFVRFSISASPCIDTILPKEETTNNFRSYPYCNHSDPYSLHFPCRRAQRWIPFQPCERRTCFHGP